MSRFMTCLRLAALVMISAVGMASAQNAILGLLEDVPGDTTHASASRGVRVVFQKSGTDWQPFIEGCFDNDCATSLPSKPPQEIAWTVAFDGRLLGHVTGRTAKEPRLYSHIGLQDITSSSPIPRVGKRSAQYGGFVGAAVYRPLVVNSRPYFKDPESWKPVPPSAELIKLLQEGFRLKFPKLCKTGKQEETKLEPFPYRNGEIKIVKVYGSNERWAMARLHLDGAIDCDDLEAGFEIDDPWFTVDPQRSVQYLGSGMWLVDGGDYDNDGKSELVFAIDRDNRGGYELFYDHFKRHATFVFSYH